MANESTNWHAECLFDSGGAKGMPQLCTDWMPNQIFWLIVALVVLYLLLARIALPRIGAVLASRKGVITNDLMVAEELRQKAREAEQAYEAALARARHDAEGIAAAARADIQQELNKAIEKADAEIAAKAVESEGRIAEIRAGALEAVQKVARTTATEIVAHLGGQTDAAAIDDAVSAAMKG